MDRHEVSSIKAALAPGHNAVHDLCVEETPESNGSILASRIIPLPRHPRTKIVVTVQGPRSGQHCRGMTGSEIQRFASPAPYLKIDCALKEKR